MSSTPRPHRKVRQNGKIVRVYDGEPTKLKVKIAPMSQERIDALTKAIAGSGGAKADAPIPPREVIERANAETLRDLVWRLLRDKTQAKFHAEKATREAEHRQKLIDRLLDERRALHRTIDLLAYKVGKAGSFGLAECAAQDLDPIPF